MSMEYFGRLGLGNARNFCQLLIVEDFLGGPSSPLFQVERRTPETRKNKERGTGSSPCQVAAASKETRCAVEPWSDTGHLNSAINETRSLTASEAGHTQGLVEFRSTSSPQAKGAAVLTHYCPRQDMFVDLEYLEYEKQVQTRARELKNGVRFGWKSLVFWKRHHHHPGNKKPSFMSSGASTPLPLSCAAATPGRRRGCATVGPVYRNESPTSQQLSHRAWKGDCNLSPYVALSDRRQRVVSPGPLYLVG